MVQTVAVKQQVAVLKPDHLAEGQRSKQSVNLSGECGFTPSEAELWRHSHTHTHTHTRDVTDVILLIPETTE